MKSGKRTIFAASVLGISGLVALAAEAQAGTGTSGPFTSTVSTRLTDWSGNLSFPKFNASLGTLTSVDLNFSSSMTTTLTVANVGNSSSTGKTQTEVQLSITDSSGILNPGGNATPQLDYESLPKFSYSLSAGNSTSSGVLTGNSSYDTGGLNATGLLTEFTGTGNISLPAATFTQTDLSNTGGNTNSTQVTDAGLTGTVTYTYTAVPEPTSVTLLVIGGSMALLRRRRRTTPLAGTNQNQSMTTSSDSALEGTNHRRALCSPER